MTMIKSAPIFEIKSIADAGVFSGYASIFGHKDSHKDITVSGCFSKSLSEHRKKGSAPKMFWQHSPSEPIGKWTLLEEDEKGLYVEGKLNLGVQRAREAHALLLEKDIDGLSIGYWPEVVEESKSQPDVMLIKQLRLVEVSLVSVGSNDRALISDVKSEIERAEAYSVMRQKLVNGDRLTERELEKGLREAFSLSSSEAVRAVACLKHAQGDPETAKQPSAELAALLELRDAFGDFLQTN